MIDAKRVFFALGLPLPSAAPVLEKYNWYGEYLEALLDWKFYLVITEEPKK
jgi:hypothetical protein